MKKLSVKLIVVAAVAVTCISAGIFYGCKKDNPLENGSGKLLKSMYGDNLQEIEYYTPEESTVNERLMQFANYMNKSQDYPMPNMELKEAVWFAETFFNIGVCEKQRYMPENSTNKKTYTLSVSFEEMEGNVFLKGNVLQEKYINLLENIVTEICPDFSLNFGDVFVQSVNYASKTIELGLTVLYGTKGHKAYDEVGRPVIVNQNTSMGYLASYPQPRTYTRSDFISGGNGPDPWVKTRDEYLRDTLMELLLNQRRISTIITNITHYKKMTDFDVRSGGCSGSGAASGSCSCRLPIHKHGLYSTCPLYNSPLLTDREYLQFATTYRNIIYNGNSNMNSLVQDIPSGYSPLYACTFFIDYYPVSMDDSPQSIWQDFGVEYTCIITSDFPILTEKILFDAVCFSNHAIAKTR